MDLEKSLLDGLDVGRDNGGMVDCNYLQTTTNQWEVSLFKFEDDTWLEVGRTLCQGAMDQNAESWIRVGASPSSSDDEREGSAPSFKCQVKEYKQYQRVNKSMIMWSDQSSLNSPSRALKFVHKPDCIAFCQFLLLSVKEASSASNLSGVAFVDEKSQSDNGYLLAGKEERNLSPFLHELDSESNEYAYINASESDDGCEKAEFDPVSVSEIPVPSPYNLMEVSYKIMMVLRTSYDLEFDVLVNDADFMEGLVNSFNICEKQHNKTWELQRISEIMINLIRGCSVDALEKMADEKLLKHVLGMLEYHDIDDITQRKDYRQLLAEQEVINSAIPIQDKLVCQTIRLNYWLKFVMDSDLNGEMEIANRLAEYIQINVQVYIQSSEVLATTLEDLYNPSENSECENNNEDTLRKRRNGVIFFQSLLGIIGEHAYETTPLKFSRRMEKGIHQLIKFALSHHDAEIQGRGLKILMSLLNDDGAQFRFDSDGEYNAAGLDMLISTLHCSGLAVQMEIIEVLKKILRTSNTMIPVGFADLSFAIMPWNATKSSEMYQFEESFYQRSAAQLYAPLISGSEKQVPATTDRSRPAAVDKALFENLCGLLAFSMEEHEPEKLIKFVADYGVWRHLANVILDNNRHKAEQLAALRCLRQAIVTVDQLDFKQEIARSGILHSLMEALLMVKDKDTLMRSSCLAVLSAMETHQEREGDALLIEKIVDCYRSQMETELSHLTLMSSLIDCYNNPLVNSHSPHGAQRSNSSLTDIDNVSDMRIKQEDAGGSDTDGDEQEEENERPQLKRSSNAGNGARKRLRSQELNIPPLTLNDQGN